MYWPNPSALSKRSPRWSLAAVAGLLAAAVLASGAPAAEPDKKAEPRKPGVGFPDIEELLKDLPGGLTPEQREQIRKEMERAQKELDKAMDDLRKQFPGGLPGAFPGGAGGFRLERLGRGEEARLGARVEKPTAALVEQLDLPKDRGQVIAQVQPDSAAAKAGLKANDILLELGGKPVPSDARDFAKLLDDIKADTPVDAVVLRKGKKETVKGLTLPEAKPARGGLRLIGPGGIVPGAPAVTTTVTRDQDAFTIRQEEGTLTLTVTGKVEDGKAKVAGVQVQDGGTAEKYEGLDKVPEKYKERVNKLLKLVERPEPRKEI